MQSYVQPDFRFISSFGSGGQKLGKMGSITDYMIRLTPSTIFGTKKKNWRKVPMLADTMTYVVALDGGEPALKALDQPEALFTRQSR